MEADVRVRVPVLANDPGQRLVYVDAQLLVELARERLLDALSGLELAARELPPSGVGLAGRALAEQDRAVGTNQDADGDIDEIGGIGARRAGVGDACDAHGRPWVQLRLRPRGDFGAAVAAARGTVPALRARRPAQSFANCQATRPEREPRS